MRKNIREGNKIKLGVYRKNIIRHLWRQIVVEDSVAFVFSILAGARRLNSDGNSAFFPEEIQQAAVIASDIEDFLTGKTSKFLFTGSHEPCHAI